jgi:uncharacterized protein YndB with AHSA1/START domain
MTMGPTHIDAPAGVPFIDMSREFDAPRELVFRAFTEPDLVRQWLGPRGYEMEIQSYEPRDGGTWRYTHRDGDGNVFAFHGVFHGPQTVDGMLQTFEFEGAPGHVALEKLDFEERDGRTIVRTHSVYQSLEARDGMVASGMAKGVNDGFDRLDELVARLQAPEPAAAGSAR